MRHRGTAYDPVLVLREAGHREVGFDTTALIEPVCVHDTPRLHIDVGRANALQAFTCVAALHQVFREARLVEQRAAFTRRAVLRGGVFKPVLFAKAVLVLRFYAARRKPVGSLPTGDLAKAGVVHP